MAEYFAEKLAEAEERIPTLEYMAGKGLLQPFNNTNSGSRKIMHGVHRDHVFPLINGEKAIVETGYEIRFGDLSSSVTAADSDYVVANKISKFSFSPNHHYYLILMDQKNKKLDVIERISYQHVTEQYGYLFNNQYIDNLQIGNDIPKGQIVQKSLAFDEYNNRKDGCNFNVAYMSLDQNMEDSVIISDVAASRLTSPLIKPVSIMINENNIPLNIYGTEEMYKCIPDIGEPIKDGILIALRKEKKEEIVYTESVENLKKTMMSDEQKLLTGTVIDINIYCNNPANLDAYHNGQFKRYYEEKMRMAKEIEAAVTPFILNGYDVSYELKKLYANSKRVLNGDQYIDKNTFSNIILEVTVLEHRGLSEGDKTSNRFGGKGVISKILPQYLMPKTADGDYVDIIFNGSTMYNRENPGQIFEIEITYIGCQVIKYIKNANCDIDSAFEMILKYISLIVPEQANVMQQQLDKMSPEQKRFFLECFINDGCIQISTKPLSDSFDIDRLKKLYEAFPWIGKQKMEVPIKDSNGKIRYIQARREMIVGKEYILRLKQFAEEKFSATSLSATNIRGENTKSKANKNYNELHSNTPIRFGNMEINNLNHLGAEAVVQNLLIHSLSPHARRLTEQMYTCDPYHIDIHLDMEAKNRGVEIVNTYLKTIGRRLVFKKIKKRRIKLSIAPMYFNQDPVIHPLIFNNDSNFDPEKDYKERMKLEADKEKKKKTGTLIDPLRFYARDMDRYHAQQKENEIAYENSKKSPRDRI